MTRLPSLAVRGLARLSGALLRPRADGFARDLGSPEAAQAALLDQLARDLTGTAYGRHHGLSGARDAQPGAAAAAFLERLPVAGYDDLAPWIERQRETGRPAVCPGPVRFWARTSGSAGPAKAIPVTAGLHRAFGAYFALWLHDLLAYGPPLRAGRAWLSVSPAPPPASGAGRRPAGEADDRRYVTGWRRALLGAAVAPDPRLAALDDPAAFRHVATLTLLAADPEIVSVWNPTLLGVLLDHAEEHAAALARDWAAGGTEREGLVFRVPRPDRRRLRALLDRYAGWPARLPALRLVSCWTEAGAAPGARALAARLPGVAVRDKGLVATEGPMTVPWAPAGGAVPLVGDVFYELEAEDGQLLRLHQATPGQVYALVVTARGGLPRYRIGDRVRVSQGPGDTPVLAFAGREADVADLVGEKLHEGFVAGALAALPLPPGAFRTLLPVREPDGRGHYVLLVDRLAAEPEALAGRLDALLSEAHRYREARRLGQLGPIRVRHRPDAAARVLHHAAAAAGARLGDVKPRALGAEVAAGAPVLS